MAPFTRTAPGRTELLGRGLPRFAAIGALLFFALAASEILGDPGLAEDVRSTMEAMSLLAATILVVVGLAPLAARIAILAFA